MGASIAIPLLLLPSFLTDKEEAPEGGELVLENDYQIVDNCILEGTGIRAKGKHFIIRNCVIKSNGDKPGIQGPM